MAGKDNIFAAQLRDYRRAAGLSQEALAERALISAPTVSNLERGVAHTPRPETVDLLADALDLHGDVRAAFIAAAREHPGSSARPPIRSAVGNLPALPTPLLGRGRELAVLVALLDPAGDTASPRLVTVTGPGGVGKTHLALTAAAEARARFHGLVFVDLASLDDPALVGGAIARALGVGELATTPLVDLVARLRERRTLLLLDNFEHLASAAPLIADLLAACPELWVLVTSRAPLLVRGEREFPLDPLALAAARDLFLARARAIRSTVDADPEAIAAAEAIAARLDCLPLALELAAAWTRLLTPSALRDQLRDRLALLIGGADDRPARQRTMRDTIRWSYDLLDPAQRRAFRWLAPLVGGGPFTAALTIVRAAAGGAASEMEALSWLDNLLGWSLIRADIADGDQPRLFQLETVRAYALERLVASGEYAAAREAHAAAFLALAMQGGGDSARSTDPPPFDRLERERNNMRAALAWFIARNDPRGVRLGAALAPFWEARGSLREGRDTLELLLSLAPRALTADTRRSRAELLGGIGRLAYRQGDYGRAIIALRECVELFTSADRDTVALPFTIRLAEALQARGDLDGARAIFVRLLALVDDLDDGAVGALVSQRLALIAHEAGDDTEAARLAANSLARAEAGADPKGGGAAHAALGVVAWACGDLEGAETQFAEALRERRRAGEARGLVLALADRAAIAALRGADETCHAALRDLFPLLDDLGERWPLAVCLERLGIVAAAVGQWTAAIAAYAAADTLRLFLVSPPMRLARAQQARDLDRARAALGVAAFDSAWQAGRDRAPLEALAAYRALIAPD